MGLSASQARLLSITARLTDNEYQSQQITNAKLRLSVQQTEAMAEYTRALNEPDLCYNIFDSQGNVISTDFTMAAIYDYAPNKNQYAVKNSAGRILVAGKEAENYEQTGSLVDFLDKYDLIDRKEIKTTERRMQEFQEDNPDWVNYREAHGQWELREPEEQIVISSKDAWTERIHNSGLYQLAMETGCIEFALQGLNCYMHVLASMLGPGEHTTSSGVTYTIYDGWCHDEEDREITDGTGHSYIEEGHTSQQWCWNTDQHPADETLKNALKEMQCCGEHEHNETVDIKDKYGNIKTDIETKAFECNQNMTVYQKLVDLLWEVHWDYDIIIQ